MIRKFRESLTFTVAVMFVVSTLAVAGEMTCTKADDKGCTMAKGAYGKEMGVRTTFGQAQFSIGGLQGELGFGQAQFVTGGAQGELGGRAVIEMHDLPAPDDLSDDFEDLVPSAQHGVSRAGQGRPAAFTIFGDYQPSTNAR